MSQGIGIYTLVQPCCTSRLYGDAVEGLTATREIRFRSPSGSGPKIFFFTCHTTMEEFYLYISVVILSLHSSNNDLARYLWLNCH